MQNLSRHHIKYVLGIDIPLNEQISISKEQAVLIVEAQILYENFLDSIKDKITNIKDSFINGVKSFGAFASTMYRIVSDGVSGSFASSLIRDFNSSDLKQKIQSILSKVGYDKLLDTITKKVEQISNPIQKLLASIGIVSAIKFLFDKFKDLDLSKDNIKKQIGDYIKSYISDSAISTLEGFITGGFSSLVKWLEGVGMVAATIYNTISKTLDRYKEQFSKKDSGEKINVKLTKENKNNKLDIDQIKKGVKAEMEHTKKIKDKKVAKKIALKIALDHIKEDPKYYDKLKKAGLEELNEGEFCPQCLAQYIKDHINTLHEAEYKGRKVQLGKPMPGDIKKFKVYVKNDKGNVVKVNFGQKGVKIKKNNPERRKSFRARHHCDTNPGPRWKARYWSCRKW